VPGLASGQVMAKPVLDHPILALRLFARAERHDATRRQAI
jgi:hypothetical protein